MFFCHLATVVIAPVGVVISRELPILFTKVVSQYSSQLAPISVDAVLKVIDPATATSVDLRDIKIVKKLG